MDSTTDTLIFYVNGKRITVTNPDPGETLLTYLRNSLRLTGSKLGCGEGGCGACTVMLSKYDRKADVIRHFSVTACLTPLCFVHGLAVTTVEGIGSVNASGRRLHPVQERIAKAHGSQCGFCTPGIVMSMYALLRNNPSPSEEDIETAFQGNLCRCTGYRPILAGFKTFAKTACCNGMTNGRCCLDPPEESNGVEQTPSSVKLFDPEDFLPHDPTQELIFPSELQSNREYDASFLHFHHGDQSWYRPTTLNQLQNLKSKYPEAKLVIGNTELGVDARVKKIHYKTFIHVGYLPELNELSVGADGLLIGAAVSLTEIEVFLRQVIKTAPECQCRSFVAMLEMLKWFAGSQIRNVASLGGNIVTASPISDLNPLLIVCGAAIHLVDKDGQRSRKTLDQSFFKGYRQVDLSDDQLLLSVEIPFTNDITHVFGFKQSHRREDDIAIVNAGMLVQFEPGSSIVRDLRIAFGGMAPVTKVAENSCKIAKGRLWDHQLCEDLNNALLGEFPLSYGSPGGSEVYRRSLMLSFLFRFFRTVDSAAQGHSANAREDSAKGLIQRRLSHASHLFDGVPSDQHPADPIGRPLVHLAALKQATGQATYVDDLPAFKFELQFAPVLSRRAHARITRVDPSPALEMEGVAGWVDHRDVPGSNLIGISRDHRAFAELETVHYGELIGGVLAETQLQAQRAAQAVRVEYEDLAPILTVEEAIEQQSFFNTYRLVDGDVEAAMAASDEVVSGEVRIGGQEHFYLETMSNLVIPKEDGGVEIHSSTQFPTDTQASVATALDVPRSLVTIRVQRLGGAFGGKETNVAPVCTPVAVAARKMGVPVRWMLFRDEDMAMTGKRHPCLAKYRLGISKTGEFQALDLKLYFNAGHSEDLSSTVAMVSVLQGHLGYRFPNIRVESFACKTNIASNTAFRGFGHPQCRMAVETSIAHAASVLKIAPESIRERNLSKAGDVLPFGVQLQSCNVRACWSNCQSLSRFDVRQTEVEAFNKSNRWKKRGIAQMPMMYGVSYETRHLNQGAALVHVYLDGSILLTHGGVEMGQGLHTKLIQVASRCLGLDMEWFRTTENATDKTPNTSSTAASFSTDLNGNAIMNACAKLLKRLDPVRKTCPGVSWPDLVKKAYLRGISLSATGFHFDPDTTFDSSKMKGRPFLYYAPGTACSEVEIDCLTGDHIVRRVDIVMDVGKSINPAIDIGQIEGAFVQGYGLMTLEELRMAPSGQYYTTGPASYKIPGFSDIPEEMNVHLLRDSMCEHPRAVFSSKAVGEPPLLLSLSVFLAIRDAIGAARRENAVPDFFRLDCPATCERIRLACGDPLVEKAHAAMPEDSGKRWDICL